MSSLQRTRHPSRRAHGSRTPPRPALAAAAAALVATVALSSSCALVDALGGGEDPVPVVDAGVGPRSLVDTGVDLDGLVALWTFEAPTALDGDVFAAFPDPSVVATLETGDNRDILTGGKVGAAVDLDGIDDRLVVDDAPALDITGPHTMTAWIFMDRLPDTDYGVVGKQRAYTVEIEADTDCIDSTAFHPDGELVELAPPDCALTPLAWHHVAAVFDGANLVVYQDGRLIAALAYGGDEVNRNDNPVLIGDNTFEPGRLLDGRIDEVTIWARALAPDEIQTIEQLQRPDGAPL